MKEHKYTERMVSLAKKMLIEYFSDGETRKSGDLEDDFAGGWSLTLEKWRATPFYPALAELVESGEVHFWVNDDEECCYSCNPPNCD